MGPPTLEIAGRSQREQKSKDGTLSSSEAPPFPPTSTESTATDPSFKLPKIQRDRKPEYSKPPSDDDEEEGALPPSADPSNSHFASSPQPDPAPPSHSGRALDYETRASWSKEDSRFSPSKPVPEVANGQATSASSEVRGYHPRVSRSPEFSRKVPRLDEGTGGLGRRDYRDYHETRALARGVDRSWDRDERERERGAPYPERRRSPVDPFDPAPPRLDAWHSSRYPRDPDPRGALYKKADDATRDKERALLGRNGASYVPLSPPRRSYQPRSPSPFSESSSRRSQGREWDDPVRLAAAPPSYSSSRDRGRDYDRSWGVRERAARAYSPRSEREREHYYRSAEPLYRGGERDARERKRSRSPVSTRAYKEDAERSHHDYHQRPSSRSPSRSVYARALPRESSPPPLPASRRSTGGAHRLSSRSRSPPPVTLKRKANFASLTESQRLAAIQAKVDLPADSDKSEPQPKPENGSSDPTISDVGNASSSRTAADASIQSSSIATAPVPGPAPPAAYDVVSGDPSLNGKPSESSTVSEKGKVIIADSSSQTASSTPPVATKSKVATLVESTPRKRARRSGPSRRRERPTLVPLSERKFYGCSSLDDYEITIKLGQGTFGEVKKGRHIATGIEVALKKVTIHDEKDGMPITALREVKLLKRLCHPSIVPVIDMAYRPSGERGKLGDVYMVEPYMDHDLNGMLENPNIDLKVPQIKLYMKQLLEGTLFLHKNKILHRDMKAANLLINNEGQLQIADFGLARPFHDPGQAWKSKGWQGGVNKYTNMVVTRWYRPPELLAGEKKYGPPIDMWGVGCILAEMVTGKPIFKGTSEINQLELISQLCGSPNEENFPGWSQLPGVKDADPSGRPDPYPEVPGRHEFGNYQRSVRLYFTSTVDAGQKCADLIDKLLVLDPRKRLTAAEALNHEWFWERPFPADPASLPKYDPSKEIDRTKREWKAPMQARNVPAPQPILQSQPMQTSGVAGYPHARPPPPPPAGGYVSGPPPLHGGMGMARPGPGPGAVHYNGPPPAQIGMGGVGVYGQTRNPYSGGPPNSSLPPARGMGGGGGGGGWPPPPTNASSVTNPYAPDPPGMVGANPYGSSRGPRPSGFGRERGRGWDTERDGGDRERDWDRPNAGFDPYSRRVAQGTGLPPRPPFPGGSHGGPNGGGSNRNPYSG